VALTAAFDPVGRETFGLRKASGFMRLGLAISIVLHLAILAWAAISISTAKPPITPEEIPVEVSLLTTSDLANLRKGSDTAKSKTTAAPVKDAEPVETPEVKAKRVATPPPTPVAPAPPDPKVEAKPSPTPPEPKAEAQIKPAPTPPEPALDPKPAAKQPDPIADIIKKAEANPPPVKKEQPKKVAESEDPVPPEPAIKPVKKKPNLDISKLQAQINQLPDAAPESGSDQPPDPTSKTKAPAVGVSHATGTQLSATEQMMFSSIFNRKVQGCWTVLAGAADAQDLVVPVSFDLAPDGSLMGPPVVTGGGNSPNFALASENVIRAITQCAPYPMPGDYGKWKHWDYTFDPRAMFGG